MKDQSLNISKLLIKKYQSALTEAEEQLLNKWLEAHPKNKVLAEFLLEKAKKGIDLSVFEKFDDEAAFLKFQQRNRRKKSNKVWFTAAAAVLAFICLSYLLVINHPKQESNDLSRTENKVLENDVLPAEKGAYLINDSGEQIKVNVNVIVNKNGDISTDSGESLLGLENQPALENTLVVPAARFFRIQLSDGTNVWINANSELRFPSVFAQHERKVKVKGEAYFEVSKDPKRPFIVESENVEIKVLGTHFNVNSYSNFCKATLAEGKISIRNSQEMVVLSPGEQAIVSDRRLEVSPANVEKDLAWKNNVFQFKGDNIVHIAKQLQNWYNLEISFTKEVSLTQTYTGEIRRDTKLSEVLQMLEYVSNLDFTIHGNKLLILNK